MQAVAIKMEIQLNESECDLVFHYGQTNGFAWGSRADISKQFGYCRESQGYLLSIALAS